MNGSTERVKGWFITTRDLISMVFGVLGATVTIVSGMYFFFSTRDSNAAVLNDRVNAQSKRIDRLEEAIYGNDGLNAKFTDVRAKLATLVAILDPKKAHEDR